ncbi:MAG: iron ABC transporter permease [Synergistota bacterium]|nr:iron ABC transporter permease [Synergistota bacterium]
MSSRHSFRFTLMAALFVCVFLVSMSVGRFPVPVSSVVRAMLSIAPAEGELSPQVETVLFQVRFPRVLLGALVGAGLSCSGTVYQAIFRNPLVSPEFLGASSGAALGAAFAILNGLGYREISLFAFLSGLAAVGLVVLVNVRSRLNPVLGFLLAGIMVGSLCSAGISYLKLIADPNNALPAITYWLMGSLASARREDVLFAAPLVLSGLILLFMMRWRINILSAGDEEAAAMGVNAGLVRGAAILGATFVTAACVSVSGVIGWIGLVVPHFARSLVGADCRRSIPASILLGGALLPATDDFSRMLSSSEVPIGILTAFVGAPFLLYIILNDRREA